MYSRYGTARAGGDYQDLWGAQILVEFLEHPDRYQWVRFEADGFGALDDIVASRTDGRYVIRQIKFTVDAENEQYEVTWDWLLRLAGRQGRGTSLLKKWADSLTPHLQAGGVYEAALYTNRRATAEIASLMSGDRISFDAITDTAIQSKIITQLGSEEAARAFFSEFRFKVDRPEPVTLEESLKSRFLALHGDMLGWLNLMAEIRLWAKYKDRPAPSGEITIQILRRAARWHRLHELPQGFELPLDYAVPVEDFHTAFLDAVRNRGRSCFVLWGSPGAGKSTYLSYLVEALKDRNTPVIRHHYFLSLTDRSGDRFSYQVVAESLMQQLQARYPEALSSIGAHNPQTEQCGEWLASCGQYYVSQNVPFVVIIDGLDHVWRERRSIEELTLLFEVLLPPPENVVVIVGTQRVSPEQLPARLLTHAPQAEWVQLPAMSVWAIHKWLESHAELLEVSQYTASRNQYLGEISRAFSQISQGHPLHLRYSFQTLIERGERVWESTILALPSCPEGDIERYYARLLIYLPDAGRQMLHLLAACDFPWPKEGLIECLSPDPGNDTEVMEAEHQIAHLLRWTPLGATAFHGSLLVFIQRQSDHKAYAQRLFPKVIEWLVNVAPEYWRWAYEWIVRAEVGELAPLRDKPNQEWVIDALAAGRPIDHIRDILQRTTWMALDEGNLARIIELVTLDHYIDNGPEFQTDEFERLLFCQIRLDADPMLKRRLLTELPRLSDKALAVVAETWAQSSDSILPEKCHEQFLERIIDAEEIGAQPGHRRETAVGTNLDLAASVGTAPPDWVLDFTRGYKTEDFNNAFGFYCRRLSSLKRVDALRAFFGQALEKDELYDLTTISIRLACEEGFNISLWTSDAAHLSLPLVACYRWLRGDSLPSPLHIEQPDSQMLMQDDASLYGLRPELIGFFHTLFFSSLALALSSNRESTDTWIASLPNHTWAGQFCHRLIESTVDLSERLKSGQLPSYAWIYEIVSAIPVPTGDPRESETRFYRHTIHALIEIALDLHLLARLRGGPAHITGEDIKKIVASPYWNREAWLDRYIENRRPLLTDEALEWLLDHELARLAGTINQLNDRYTDYARLAQIAVLHGARFAHRVQELLHRAAACVIAYGYHKDYRLFEVLETIETCHKAGVGETERWLFNLAPMVAAVRDFTDGDETSILIADWAGTILTVRPDLFPEYHQHLLSNEEWYDAERVMHIFIKQADLSDPVNQAIALTVVDDGGLKALKSRSESDTIALAVFEAQQRFLGGITLKEQDSSRGAATEADAPPVPPPLEDYPPEKFKGYLEALRQQRMGYRYEFVTAWFEHWAQAGYHPEVLDALEDVIRQERFTVMVDHLFDRIFELCRALRGKSAAFPWLVRAHRARHGWSGGGWLWTPEEEAARRFAIVARDYKDRWLEFIQEAASPRYTSERLGHRPAIGFSRLVKLCLAVEQTDMAATVAEAIVITTLERIADLNLPLPSWISSP